MTKTAYANARVLTGRLNENGKMVEKHGTVLVENGRFTAVCPDTEPDLSGYTVIDLKGSYLMPGLINMHVHLPLAGGPPKKKVKKNRKPVNYKKLFDTLAHIRPVMAVYLKMQENNAKNAFLGGTTTVRTVGGILDMDSKIRDKAAEGRIIGPRILASDMCVSVPGGHFAGSLGTEAKSPEEAAADVRRIHAMKPDWIKIMVTGGVMDAEKKGEPGVLRMKPELIRAACDEAHRLGYRVAAHVESNEGVKEALKGGVDSVEHGGMPDEEMLDLFKEKKAMLVATLSPAAPAALCPLRPGEDAEDMERVNSTVVFNSIVECAKACLKAGIPVGLGTDAGCPMTAQYDTWRELRFWQKFLGVSPDFALWSATLNNAQLLGLGEETGSIEAGKSADFIVTKKNPLEDLFALRTLEYVALKGNAVKDPKPKKYAVSEQALDEILT